MAKKRRTKAAKIKAVTQWTNGTVSFIAADSVNRQTETSQKTSNSNVISKNSADKSASVTQQARIKKDMVRAVAIACLILVVEVVIYFGLK